MEYWSVTDTQVGNTTCENDPDSHLRGSREEAGAVRRWRAGRPRPVPPRPPDEVRARLQVLGPADSGWREAHEPRTRLVSGGDAQGREAEGAGEQAGGPLGPRPERGGSSHLRGGRREGDRDSLADVEEPPRMAGQWRQTLRDYAYPRIGRKRVGEVSTADVLTILKPIWSSKPPTAKAVRNRISAVMRWAVAKGYRPDNPAGDAIAARRVAAQRQHHPASQGAASRRSGGGSGQDSQLGVPCRHPAGVGVHGPDGHSAPARSGARLGRRSNGMSGPFPPAA